MTAPLFLSRARLRRHVPAAALRELLLPDDDGRRAGAGHRLVWTLFADAPDRERDFLWREADQGVFYLLSGRPPEDRHGLFELDPPKPFAPALRPGDRLAFALRANATVARVKPGKVDRRGRPRSVPCDVVMDALRAVPPGERAEARRRAVESAGGEWLAAQGARAGFALAPASGDGTEEDDGVPSTLRVIAYRTLRVEHAGPTARIGVLDFEGVLEVREPARFIEAVAHGFGRAKAFGCGLMLVRRA
jgi:CRISPR system Cascade subunit CasE